MLRQVKTLIKKTLLEKTRNPATIQEIVLPVVYLVVIIVLVRVVPIISYPAWTQPSPPPLVTNGTGLQLAYSPGNSSLAAEVMQLVANSTTNPFYGANVVPLSDPSDVLARLNETFAYVEFQNLENAALTGSALEIKLRFMSGTVPSTSGPAVAKDSQCRGENFSCPTVSYISSGFLSLQAALVQSCSKAMFNETIVDLDQASFQAIPLLPLTTSAVYLSTMTAVYVVIAFWPLVGSLITGIVTEKEKKLKDGMFAMGLTEVPYFLSWMLVQGLFGFITTIIMSIMLVAGGVLGHSNFFLVWLVLYLYAISVTGFAFCISTLFNSAKTAAAIGTWVSIIFAAVYYPLMNVGTPSATALWLCSFFSPIALSLAVGQAFLLDTSGVGLNFATVWTSVGASGFSVGSCYVMMIIDIVIYFLLAIYLDRVVPGDTGPKLHPLFCCMRKRSAVPHLKGKQIDERTSESQLGDDSKNIEPLPDDAPIAISIHNIRKVYPNGTVALEDVTFDVRQGEIFGLLGHNASGKTTLCSILSGQFFASSGTARILDLDVQTEFQAIRSKLGLCPQHDLLFDFLTVREHLDLFSGIKSGTTEEVNEILDRFDLTESQHKIATTLSGGQKRKLSCGIAMIGNSKIVILDEPTAGMDVYSRHKMWEALRETSQDRVIIVTSHLLDEIDALTDRKAILSHGRIRCLGTSLFLKTNFGLGYRLTIDLSNNGQGLDEHSIVNAIKRDAPDVIQEIVGAKISLRVPSVNNVPKILERLDEMKIESFTVDVSTLEDVFLHLENDVGSGNDPTRNTVTPLTQIACKNESSFQDQFRILVKMKYRQMYRLPRAYILAVLSTVVIQIIGLAVGISTSTTSTIPTVQLQPAILFPNRFALFQNLSTIPEQAALTPFDFPVTRFPSSGGDLQTYLVNSTAIAGIVLENVTNTFTLYFDVLSIHSIPAFWGSIMAAISPMTIKFSSQPLPSAFDSPAPPVSSILTPLLIALPLSVAPVVCASDIVRDRARGIAHQLVIQGIRPMVFWVSYFTRDMCFMFLLVVVTLILLAAFAAPGLSGPALLPVFILLLLYLPKLIIVFYLVTFLVSRPDLYTSITTFAATLLSIVPFLVVFILDIAGNPTLALKLHYIFVAFDPFNLATTLYYVIKVPSNSMANYFAISNVVLGSMLLMLAQMLLVGLALILADTQSRRRRHHSNKRLASSGLSSDVHPDVTQERLRVEDETTDDILVARHLVKSFMVVDNDAPRKPFRLPKKKLFYGVDDLSFGVKSNECFGLLGPNGAGKTLCLGMLTGQTVPTSGSGFVNGADVTLLELEAFHNLGYCPQFDCLFDELSSREHLQLICTIKGIENVDERVEQALEAINLKEHADKMSKTLSGGTKRKLSFCISIISSPLLTILDEPSTGMDPRSRRFMWEIIRANAVGRACLLTTHNMEEADALCTRIGILTNGKMQAIGSSSHLKQTFGQGYRLDIKVAPSEHEGLDENFMSRHFPGFQKLDSHEENLVYRIPVPKKLGAAFNILLQAKQDGVVKDFTLGQVTLGQVFSMIVDSKM